MNLGDVLEARPEPGGWPPWNSVLDCGGVGNAGPLPSPGPPVLGGALCTQVWVPCLPVKLPVPAEATLQLVLRSTR